MRLYFLLVWAGALVGAGAVCPLAPSHCTAPKSPGDNYYRLVINGDVERYAPGERYVVTLVGTRTHDVVQKFTRFKLVLDPLAPPTPPVSSAPRLGQFQLFADTLTQFDDGCFNSVTEADELPKTEIQVMWKAPPTGSGCVLLKAMVYENESRWFAEDGQLTKRVCEDTSLNMPDCCACDDAKYKMVFEGLWSPQTHPKDFPTKALWLTHFSDIIGATHPRNFSFWGEGQIATDGFRSLAEWGSVGLQESGLRQQGKLLRSIVKAQGLWHPRVNSNTSTVFSVDRRRPYLSLASMFGPSPDWVVGVNGLNLCQKDCSWVESQVVDLFPYDAGTDNGITYMSPNSETVPRERIYRITPMYPEDPRAPFYNPGASEVPPLARLYLTREKLVTRACDEDALQALVDDQVEDTPAADRPECAVGEWSAWSACSVSCGKGLRMRTREYRMPPKAAMFGCDRQLVSKEMCVADLPECPPDEVNEEEPSLAGSEVEDIGSVCATSEWGAWTECSVTCGVGVAVRRRHFLDRMGFKKCPLVPLEENRKCMQPECAEEEHEEVDPACPTSEWSGWSACSASCGRGVRFRTRLLLVPPERARACSSRVQLLQQRACSERQDCTLDMLTAKRICMEAAEAGPCSGVYQRWTFVAAKGMCVPFQYGGCRGNQNNFISQQDCLDTCSVILGVGAPNAIPAPLGQPARAASPNDPAPGVSSTVPRPAVPDPSLVPGPNDCQMSAWSDWSPCSVTCGSGYQERIRTILVQAGPAGAPCPTRKARRRRCLVPC